MGWLYYWIGVGMICLATSQSSFMGAFILFGAAFIFRALVYGIEKSSC